jgi:hypothetical protein
MYAPQAFSGSQTWDYGAMPQAGIDSLSDEGRARMGLPTDYANIRNSYGGEDQPSAPSSLAGYGDTSSLMQNYSSVPDLTADDLAGTDFGSIRNSYGGEDQPPAPSSLGGYSGGLTQNYSSVPALSTNDLALPKFDTGSLADLPAINGTGGGGSDGISSAVQNNHVGTTTNVWATPAYTSTAHPPPGAKPGDPDYQTWWNNVMEPMIQTQIASAGGPIDSHMPQGSGFSYMYGPALAADTKSLSPEAGEFNRSTAPILQGGSGGIGLEIDGVNFNGWQHSLDDAGNDIGNGPLYAGLNSSEYADPLGMDKEGAADQTDDSRAEEMARITSQAQGEKLTWDSDNGGYRDADGLLHVDVALDSSPADSQDNSIRVGGSRKNSGAVPNSGAPSATGGNGDKPWGLIDFSDPNASALKLPNAVDELKQAVSTPKVEINGGAQTYDPKNSTFEYHSGSDNTRYIAHAQSEDGTAIDTYSNGKLITYDNGRTQFIPGDTSGTALDPSRYEKVSERNAYLGTKYDPNSLLSTIGGWLTGKDAMTAAEVQEHQNLSNLLIAQSNPAISSPFISKLDAIGQSPGAAAGYLFARGVGANGADEQTLITLGTAGANIIGATGSVGYNPIGVRSGTTTSNAQTGNVKTPNNISRSDLGNLLGRGGNKDVYALGENQAVGVLRNGTNPKVISDEIDMLNKLSDAGIPTVNPRAVSVDGTPGMQMDRFAQGSKDVVRLVDGKVRIVGDSPLLNQQSVNDLQAIRDTMVNDKIQINDLQFLIDKDGHVVVADPLAVNFNTDPSKNNLRMIDLLIKVAQNNGKN